MKSLTRQLPLIAVCLPLILAGCSSVDPGACCRLDTASAFKPRLRKGVSRCKLLKQYFKQTGERSNVLEISLNLERKRRRSSGGDYDSGKVDVVFLSRHIPSDTLLYEREAEVELEPFMIGLFDENASREELTDIAFKRTEEKLFPYIQRWLDLTAIRAMAHEGSSSGKRFVPLLTKVAEDKWSGFEMQSEAEAALKLIDG